MKAVSVSEFFHENVENFPPVHCHVFACQPCSFAVRTKEHENVRVDPSRLKVAQLHIEINPPGVLSTCTIPS